MPTCNHDANAIRSGEAHPENRSQLNLFRKQSATFSQYNPTGYPVHRFSRQSAGRAAGIEQGNRAKIDRQTR